MSDFVQRVLVTTTSIISLLLGILPSPAWAHGWADDPNRGNCRFSPAGTNITYWNLQQARNYAFVGNGEGYQWGGGCWNDNNVKDQTTSVDEEVLGAHGEGGDCSGFVFKTWALKLSKGVNGKHEWLRKDYVHGDYNSGDFKNPQSGWPFTRVSKTLSATHIMDSFAKHDGTRGHVGLIYTEATGQGQDTIIEALCELCGTITGPKNYRYLTEYRAASRVGWSDCSGCV